MVRIIYWLLWWCDGMNDVGGGNDDDDDGDKGCFNKEHFM